MMSTGIHVGRLPAGAVGFPAVGTAVVPAGRRRPFAGQRVAEHAGRPVTARVHGTVADGHGGPAVPGVRATSDQRLRRVPRPVTGAALRLGGHARVADRPTVGDGRPDRRPPRARAGRRRPERFGRGRRAAHRTSAAAVRRRTPAADAQVDGRPRGLAPVVRRQVFRHVIVPLRRHRLHWPAAGVRELVVARQRGPRPFGVRPLGKAGPVHRQAVELLAGPRARRPRASRRCRPGPIDVAAPYVQRFVRLPVQVIILIPGMCVGEKRAFSQNSFGFFA